MNKAANAIRRFFESIYYPILVSIWVFIGHSTGFDIAFCGVIILTFALGCMLCKSFNFAIPLFFCTFFLVTIEHGPNVPNYSDYYAQTPILIILAIYVLVIIGSLACFVVKNHRNARKLNRNGLWLGLLLFCATLCANGVFSPNYTAKNLFYAAAFLLMPLGVYLLFYFFTTFDERSRERFALCLVLTGLLICAELLFAYCTTVQFTDGNVVKESVVLGWGVWTTIGGLLCLFMPASFYFAASSKHGWLGILSGILHLICILLSQSRGALLIGAGLFALCMIILCFVGKNKKQNRIIAACLVLFGILGGVVLFEKIQSVLQNFINYGFGDNGRFAIWQTGLEKFLSNPIFGSGFYDSYINEEWTMSVVPYFYHNTLIQILASVGLIGFAAYLFHRVQTVLTVCKRPNIYKTFMGICILGLLLFCMLDVLFFCIYPMIFYALILVFMEQDQ